VTPQIFSTPAQVREFRAKLTREGKRLALVPTMGFLHQGHQSLMQEGLRRADVVAVTIFVNPTQFGPKEDLSRYPRDFEGDVKRCASVGVAAIYAPEPSTVYPEGYQTYVNVEQVSQGLCGDRRPGHFRGVATVVTKLLALFRPEVALFGEKDYQQLQVIKRLNADLELGVEIVGQPTIREADGLAMSSRNAYLSPEDRARGLAISKGLFSARSQVAAGERSTAPLVATIEASLTSVGARIDYVEVRDAATLAPAATLTAGRPARALVAAFFGTTRLIDNLEIFPG
jgi:pantoate--beta-alanine ligase